MIEYLKQHPVSTLLIAFIVVVAFWATYLCGRDDANLQNCQPTASVLDLRTIGSVCTSSISGGGEIYKSVALIDDKGMTCAKIFAIDGDFQDYWMDKNGTAHKATFDNGEDAVKWVNSQPYPVKP